jgi:hypothetical protein
MLLLGPAAARAGTFGDDVSFLRAHTEVVVLERRRARVAVAPAWQGRVVTSTAGGAPAPGAKPLGPFYELETSSPGAELAPGAALDHVHRTMHFQGERPALEAMARACLGVGLAEIEGVFKASSAARPRGR